MNILFGVLLGSVLGVLIARINWYKLYRKLPLGVVNSILYFGSIAVFIALFLSLVYVSCNNTARANIPEKVMTHNEYDSKVITAYSHLLHRIWILKPSFVEDVLVETDEFIELNELLNENWEDTFYFWNKQDSIDYQYNWNGGESACVHTDY